MTGKRIAVYSGSFNPLHIGHLAIIRHLIEKAGFDMVYLIVSPKNPLKEGISSASGRDRYNAAVEAVKRHFPAETGEEAGHSPTASGCLTAGKTGVSPASAGKVKVDDIELTMPEPHYTIRTLDTLKEREPDNTFTLVMGADNLADIRRWKDYGRILKEYGAAVYPRNGFDLDQIRKDLLQENPAYEISLLDAEMVDISSTIIREAIASGKDVSSMLM